MSTVGLIGGIAPASTILYYQEIVATYRRRTGDDSYPRIVINSINLTQMLDLVKQNDMRALENYLSDALQQLARAGVDFGVFASNTPHMIFDKLSERSPFPLISIVEETANRAHQHGFQRVGLIGARFTMQRTFYAETFAKKKIEVLVPNSKEQEFIHNKYMNEFVQAVFKDETKAEFIEITRRMQERFGIEALILGGTELSLILKDENEVGLPCLDTTRIHIDTIVNRILAGEQN